MRFAFAVFAGYCLITCPGAAQVAQSNVNVLPIYFNDENDPQLPFDPEAFIKGDLFLQRQLEPTVAVSTRNPDHVLAFFNDYRAVDIADDPGLGEATSSAFAQAAAPGPAGDQLARFNARRRQRRSGEAAPGSIPALAAVSEAWVGMSRSGDGGTNWSGGFLPGAPFDQSPASLASPVHGLEAATDPVLSAAPCGRFYLVFVAFTRGGESKLAVARYVDPNVEGGDIEYEGTTVLESGNNANNGYFLDKPYLDVDVLRTPSADACAHNVYVSYTTFNGLQKDGKIQSKVTFAKSTNGGVSFVLQKLNMPFNQNQGTWMAIDPRAGTPTTTGGGTIYLFWRHFFDPNAILVTKSTNYGSTFPGKPVQLTSSVPLASFDQPTAATTAVGDPVTQIAFRSNGFPSAAATSTGAVFAAWQERVDLETGEPDPTGSPRVVVMRSTDGGTNWTGFDPATGAPGPRRAVDFGDRDVGCGSPAPPPYCPAPGFGALPQERPSGPQVMPVLTSGGGRLLLSYYESRGFATTLAGHEVVQPADLTPSTGFISGIDRLVDLRAALLSPATGALLGTSQVSRYPIKALADLSQETLEDVAAVNPPCAPDFGEVGDGLPACVRSVNRVNWPTSGGGLSPFIGDYVFQTPAQKFVPRSDGSGWRWATAPVDLPYQGFHVVFADNRHVIPPDEPAGLPLWQRFPSYSPPDTGSLSCINAGARNTDVLTARVAADLLVSVPITHKQLSGLQGAFPISLTNNTGDQRYFMASFLTGGGVASLHQVDPELDCGAYAILPYSSVTVVVYVDAAVTTPVQLQVQEIEPPSPDADTCAEFVVKAGGSTGVAAINFDPSNLNALPGNTEETHNALVSNALVSNALVSNALVSNALVSNFSVSNALVSNALVSNALVSNALVSNSTIEEIIDTTWQTTGDGSTASAYQTLLGIDDPEQYGGAYLFQLLIYKASAFGALDACDPVNVGQDEIISIITPESALVSNALVSNALVSNALVSNALVSNALVSNALVSNALVSNATFTVAPSDEAVASRGLVQRSHTGSADGTTKAPLVPPAVGITLRAYRLAPVCGDENDTDPQAVCVCPAEGPCPERGVPAYDPRIDPPAITIVAQSCNTVGGDRNPVGGFDETCFFTFSAPDLAVVETALAPSSSEIEAGQTITFPVGGFTVVNQGTVQARAETALRHGVYLSSDSTFDPTDVLLASVTATSNPLAASDDESFAAFDLSIPDTIAQGNYFLLLFVDDLREASEVDETNNVVAAALHVLEPNEPPVATDGAFSVNEDGVLQAVLSGSDPNGDPLAFTIATPPTKGTAVVTNTATGAFTYTPAANLSGDDSFTFQVADGRGGTDTATATITIHPINDPPVASNGSLTTLEDTAGSGVLSASDVEGGTLSFSIVAQGAKGAAAVNAATGAFTYTPNANANGSDSFTFKANDGAADSNVATVTITIQPVNDAPVALAGAATTNEDTPVSGALQASDADGNALSFSIVAQGTKGVTVVNAATGAFTYTPNANVNGSDSFSFKVNDGTTDSNVAVVTVTIGAVNDPPVAVADTASAQENAAAVTINVLANDSDPEGAALFVKSVNTAGTLGTVTFTAANVTFKPAVNFVGVDSFVYEAAEVGDPTRSATAAVTVTVDGGLADYRFCGLLSPWRQTPRYRATIGSAVPLAWQYADADPACQHVIASSGALPEVHIRGPFSCSGQETASTVEIVAFPGNSGFQYFTATNTHQFNWDTSGLGAGCYNVRILSQLTRQLNGPFVVELRTK